MFKFKIQRKAAFILAYGLLLSTSLFFGSTSKASATLYPYVGNTHAHSVWSADAVSSNNDYSNIYDDAIGAGTYDFYAITDHSDPTSFVNHWALASTQADSHTSSNFVGIRGFEYTLNSDQPNGDDDKGKGHINVFGSTSYAESPKGFGSVPKVDLPDFYNWLKSSDAVAASFNHPGPHWGNFDNFAYRDDALNDKITMIEVINGYDAAHTYTYRDQYVQALDMGWKLGAVAGHDNHDPATIGTTASRTGVLATALTRTAVLDAMKNHRTWASLDTNLKINKYVINNADIGSTINRSNNYNFTINVSDPDISVPGDKITKINIIKNTGAVAATLNPNAYATGDLTTSITNDSSSTYFCLEVYTVDDPNAPTLYSAPIFIAPAGGAVPAAPVQANPTAGNAQITVNWGTVSGASGYKVKYGTTSGSYATTIDVGNATSKTITGLTNGTTYYFAVSAYNASGEGANSNEKSAAPASGVTTLFSDDFEDGNATGWTNPTGGGTWSVVTDGSKMFKDVASGTSGQYAGDSSWSNYTLEADVKPVSWTAGGSASLSARFQNDNNRYLLSLNQSNDLTIMKKINGVLTTLATEPYTFTLGTTYHMKVVLQGSSIELWINGAKELTATDSSLSTGSIGLNTYKGTTEFDNVVVTG